MKRGYLKSSPYFFRLIKIALTLTVLTLMALTALIPAPLQEQANLARVPNPVKSAWFLLWIQELVSYSKYLIYLVLALTAAFIALPWLSRSAPPQGACWFPRESRVVNCVALAICVAVLALTLVAMFCRGANWQFVSPF
ncbi:selenite/tellurite reduction operon b-type cytochrome membrane protein ExtQ [Geomonas anaerohicana]|uniref:Cytochrome B6 n=1 Tax=Geomonas anaerohicana TaxID=2798583 RepID=A0ABS0YJ17_9BACT|nr:selenite/tellurite reduction operon b-type cytochrome membrane protein ExtQ [Geomonas anaerohicana]MBJ6752310.1 cytochrome B6 [Geomonas anaerohicana]